jgi:hypothetical protein
MEEESQHPVTVVGAVDLVSMAQIDLLSIQVEDGRSAEYPGIEGLLEEGPHVKIVVPFEIYDPYPLLAQLPELFQHWKVVPERDHGVSDPELEQVPEDEKCIGFFRQSGEEIEQNAVVYIGFVFQMGVRNKYLAHDSTITENKIKVKVEVKIPRSGFRGKMMNMMRGVELVWDDLLDAFENTDPDIIYFLDKNSGEIFFVPVDYEDDDFWEEMEINDDQFLEMPGFDFEKERLLVHDFIKGVNSPNLRDLLTRAFVGKRPYGRLDEILTFYPEEMERLSALKEQFTNDRVRSWLEEHDIFTFGGSC